MEHRKIADGAGLKTYAVIMSEGDEAVMQLTRFAEEERLTSAQVSGIGAASSATLAWLNFDEKKYQPFSIEEQIEVVSFLGDVALTQDGKPQLHAHVTVAKRDGSVTGGHLLQLHVRPTLELIVTVTPARLRKRPEPGMPVATIRLAESD